MSPEQRLHPDTVSPLLDFFPRAVHTHLVPLELGRVAVRVVEPAFSTVALGAKQRDVNVRVSPSSPVVSGVHQDLIVLH